jgi:hypothetical protein
MHCFVMVLSIHGNARCVSSAAGIRKADRGAIKAVFFNETTLSQYKCVGCATFSSCSILLHTYSANTTFTDSLTEKMQIASPTSPIFFEAPSRSPTVMQEQVTKIDTLDQLQTAEQVLLLDKIDELRNKGLSHHGISLPQLIVCGDQSSGKSSLLEGLTRLRFPTDDSKCLPYRIESRQLLIS